MHAADKFADAKKLVVFLYRKSECCRCKLNTLASGKMRTDAFCFIFHLLLAKGIVLVTCQSKSITFSWDEQEFSPDHVPLLRIKFPNNNGSDEVAILKRFNPIKTKKDPAAPLDKCIFTGSLRDEPNVLVTVTDGCPPSNSFQIQFQSQRFAPSMFVVRDGIGKVFRMHELNSYDASPIHHDQYEETTTKKQSEDNLEPVSYLDNLVDNAIHVYSRGKELAQNFYEGFDLGLSQEAGLVANNEEESGESLESLEEEGLDDDDEADKIEADGVDRDEEQGLESHEDEEVPQKSPVPDTFHKSERKIRRETLRRQAKKIRLMEKLRAYKPNPEQLEWFEIQKRLFTELGTLRELPMEGLTMIISLWYDQIFKDKFKEDSVNVLRRGMAHAQHLFQYPSLQTKILFQIKGAHEIPMSLKSENPSALLETLGQYPQDKTVHLNLFLSYHDRQKEDLEYGFVFFSSACTHDLRFRVAVASFSMNSLRFSRMLAKVIAKSLGINEDFNPLKIAEKRVDREGHSCGGGLMDYRSDDNLHWSTCSVESLMRFYGTTSLFNEDEEGLCLGDNHGETIMRGEDSLTIVEEETGDIVTLLGRHKCVISPGSSFYEVSLGSYLSLLQSLDACPEDDNSVLLESAPSQQM